MRSDPPVKAPRIRKRLGAEVTAFSLRYPNSFVERMINARRARVTYLSELALIGEAIQWYLKQKRVKPWIPVGDEPKSEAVALVLPKSLIAQLDLFLKENAQKLQRAHRIAALKQGHSTKPSKGSPVKADSRNSAVLSAINGYLNHLGF
jgi:hypothetical protein